MWTAQGQNNLLGDPYLLMESAFFFLLTLANLYSSLRFQSWMKMDVWVDMAQGCPRVQALEASQCLWHRDLFAPLLRGPSCPCTFLTQLREANNFPKTPWCAPAAAAVTLVCAGVVHVGRDPVAAAVCHRVPVLLLLHPADSLQDAAGHLTDAGEDQPGGEQTLQVACWRLSSLGSSMQVYHSQINPGSAGHDWVSLPCAPWQGSSRGSVRCQVSWQSPAEGLGTIRVLFWADWFPARRHISAAQTHHASGMSPDPLLSLAFPPCHTGAAGHPGPGAGLL